MENEDSSNSLDRIAIPAMTLIHIQGIPFWLEKDTTVLGRLENIKLVGDYGEEDSADSSK